MGTTHLGGRIPLFDPARLTGRPKAVYDRLTRTMVKWADKSGFQSTEGDRLIGPFNPVLLSPGITPAFLDLQDAEQANASLDARVRQVVILTVGAVWHSKYELYAHAAVAAKTGLPEGAIQALASGEVPDELSGQEKLAARFARALSTGHRVEAALYRDAQAAFGPHGLVDIVYLAGCCHIVCGLLNAFEIPSSVEPHQAASGGTKQAKLTTIALFPVRSFLGNLAVRSDNSVLVTSMNARELLHVPPSSGDRRSAPRFNHRSPAPHPGPTASPARSRAPRRASHPHPTCRGLGWPAGARDQNCLQTHPITRPPDPAMRQPGFRPRPSNARRRAMQCMPTR